MEGRVEAQKNKFLKLNLEKKEFNQYWFSEKTIEFIVNQIKSNTKTDDKIALVSCPSIFFSMEKDIQDKSYLFDIDEKLIKKHKNAVMFDFNDFSQMDKLYDNYFDYILIDPPFIAKEPWSKFAEFAKKIGKNEVKILTCSIVENEGLLENLLNLKKQVFQPSIPHLVYQYTFYANYDDKELNEKNAEIIEN